jgi:hypothetical protein
MSWVIWGLLWPADHPTQRHPTQSVPRIPAGNESRTARRPSQRPPRPGKATGPEHPKPPPRTDPRAPTKFDDLFGGPAQEEDDTEAWGDSWGYCRPNTPPTDAGTHRTEATVPAPAAVPGGLDLMALLSTLLKAQADAPLAQTNDGDKTYVTDSGISSSRKPTATTLLTFSPKRQGSHVGLWFQQQFKWGGSRACPISAR